MSLTYGAKQVLHRIRVKLYPNYLPGQENTFIARTDSEAVLSIEEVCAAYRNRGGFTGNLDDLIKHVKGYLNESAYQICDGFTVNNGFYSIYPNLGGTFATPHEKPAPDKNPLNFRLRANQPLRSLAETIEILVDGIADTDAYIDEFILHKGAIEDVQVNSTWISGRPFTLHGYKIKIECEGNPECGVYFASADNPSVRHKVDVFIENNPSSIRGIVPAMTGINRCKVIICTQYSGSGGLLKNIRTITSPFVLEQGSA